MGRVASVVEIEEWTRRLARYEASNETVVRLGRDIQIEFGSDLLVDVNGDEELSPLDALLVINHLNTASLTLPASGEGESMTMHLKSHSPPAYPDGENSTGTFTGGRLVAFVSSLTGPTGSTKGPRDGLPKASWDAAWSTWALHHNAHKRLEPGHIAPLSDLLDFVLVFDTKLASQAAGSSIPLSANPLRRSRQASQCPQLVPSLPGS